MTQPTPATRTAIGIALATLLATPAWAATFTTDTTADTKDATPGDGICADASGACSLRAAIEEANALAGADVVDAIAGTYVLALGQLVVKDDMTLSGRGSAASTVIDANAASRVLLISATATSVTLENLTIRNGTVNGNGAGIGSSAGHLLLRNLIITGNVSTGDSFGGGLALWSPGTTTVIENSVISRNSAAHGGGIMFANNNLELRNSAVTFNRGSNWPYYTAGVFDYSNQPSSLIIENGTIAGNEGASIKLYEAATTITNATISGNLGNGIRAERNSNVTLSNSILYGNAPNCSVNGGVISSAGHNIDGRNTCGFAAAGDRVNTDPMLGPLADNGGLTPTRGLLAGSPALDGGDNAGCPATDQRGTARSDGACDIGAFEGSVPFATCLPAPLNVDGTADTLDAVVGDGICADADGICSLRAAIQEANACLGKDIVLLPAGTYPLTIAGVNENAATTGDLDITDDLSIQGAGAATTVVDGGDTAFDDRLFHVLNNVAVTFDSLTLQGSHPGGNISGGAITTGGDLQVSNAVIAGNTAGKGGAIYALDAGSTTDISNTTLADNTGTSGGAAHIAGTLNLSASTVSGNTSRSEGHAGAIIGAGGSTINITASSLTDNTTVGRWGKAAVFGLDRSTVNVIDTTVSGTQDGRGVGGWTDAKLNIVRSRVSGNLAGGVGIRGAGAVLNIIDSTIDANSTPYWGGTSGIDGAGIAAEGTFHIIRSTISNNVIHGYANGAGISGVSGTIANSTISGNRMDGPGNNSGGGLSISGNVSITSSTIANNNISRGGGWISHGGGIAGGTVVLENTILSKNWPNNCELTTVTSNGHNIESHNTCGLTHATDQVDTDPLLDVLADNGGWTQTHALLAGSPALDAGDATLCAGAPVDGVDQRGFSRPPACDIGAYEAMPLHQLDVTLNGTGSGRVVSQPGTLDCPDKGCSTRIGENTSVLLLATAGADSVFSGWGGDCATTEGGNGRVLVDADKTCTATFDPIQHTLTVIVNPLGAGTVTSTDESISCGTDCTETRPGTESVITLKPRGETGWSFAGWEGCENPVGTSTWCAVKLDVDRTLTANFVAANIDITDSAEPADDRDIPFGEVTVGTSVQRTVTITNTGEGDLNEIWVQNSDYLSAPFSISESCSDDWLAPGASCSFTVSFTPTATGAFSDSFDIIAEDPDEPVVTITVSGTGAPVPAPAIGSSDSDLLFGNVNEGGGSNRTITLTNNGTAPLVIGPVAGSDGLAEPFSLLSDGCTGQTLAPGASCTLTVHFAPDAEGGFTDSFDIASNDPANPTLTVRLSGTGTVLVPTAETGFRLVGHGGGGGGASGPLELLLTAAGLFAVRRRRNAASIGTLAAIGLLALVLAPPAPAQGTGWYAGASGGWSRSDFKGSDLENHLVATGHAVGSVAVDDNDSGWKVFGGYQFTPHWALEAAWADLGKVGSTVEGTVDDAQVPALLADAAEGHGYMGKGLVLAGVAAWPVNPQFAPFLKLGLYRWWADIDVKEETTGQSLSRSRSGSDLMGGIGLRFMPAPNWEIRGEYEHYRTGSYQAGFFSLGVGYRF